MRRGREQSGQRPLYGIAATVGTLGNVSERWWRQSAGYRQTDRSCRLTALRRAVPRLREATRALREPQDCRKIFHCGSTQKVSSATPVSQRSRCQMHQLQFRTQRISPHAGSAIQRQHEALGNMRSALVGGLYDLHHLTFGLADAVASRGIQSRSSPSAPSVLEATLV
jgi:hypothetical protein